MILEGKISTVGVGDMKRRMLQYPSVFERATGEKLFPGTLNVDVGVPVDPIRHFMIAGRDIGEPSQDLWFEICRINGIWAYRIRPYRPIDGLGGHHDGILEISCAKELRPILARDAAIRVEMFR